MRYVCGYAGSSVMPGTSCMAVQTPVKKSPHFERMLEEAMKRGDAAAFTGLSSISCWSTQHHLPKPQRPLCSAHWW